MNKKKINVLLSLILASSMGMACSNIAIQTDTNTIVGRTLDFEENTGNVFGMGRVGDVNHTRMNVHPVAHSLTWTNRYDFVGQTGMNNPNIIDGINAKGLYAGFFYLPGITQYPQYNQAKAKPALGVFDVVNYVLGEASSVPNAIHLLNNVQMVENAIALAPNTQPGVYGIMPMHILLRDQAGHSAVIEFIKGQAHITQNIGPVLTNSPSIEWQRHNAAQYNYVRTNNTQKRYDGLYMNGSGFDGIPGDWTPPGRFARATQVIKHFPKSFNDTQATLVARQALSVVEVPLGVNPSPTLWESMANLKANTYSFRPMLHVVDQEKHVFDIDAQSQGGWQTVSLLDLVKRDSIPSGWLHAILGPSYPVTKVERLMQPTQGPASSAPNPVFNQSS